jgi:heme-degrading monooxygenase HmoA
MILERARFHIQPGAEQAFEHAFETARTVISQASGYHSLRLLRGIEHPSEYLLLIEWDSVADHMEGFRGSELYERWAELLKPHYAAPPEVEHFDSVVSQ